MNVDYLFERLTLLSYRVASHVMANLADDAWRAAR